jgi:putative ABC transport system substrate-binding protein
MTRRLLLFLWIPLGVLLALVAPADSAEIPRIAVLLPEAAVASSEVGLRDGLRDQDYLEGRDIVIEWRRIGGSIEDARPHVAELVRSKVALILALNTSSARAAMEATSTIPIVFVSADPVATGLAKSMARPGGNATGVSVASPELVAKRLDLLHQVLPHVRRIAFLRNPNNASIARQDAEAQKAAHQLGVQLEAFDARNAVEIETSLRAIQRSAPGAILVASDLWLLKEKARIASTIRKARIPAMFPWKEYHEHGALMSYGPDLKEVTRRTAFYIVRILKGASPADLPVEEISKFDLVFDLRVARELKIEVPEELLYRADEVIQ